MCVNEQQGMANGKQVRVGTTFDIFWALPLGVAGRAPGVDERGDLARPIHLDRLCHCMRFSGPTPSVPNPRSAAMSASCRSACPFNYPAPPYNPQTPAGYTLAVPSFVIWGTKEEYFAPTSW
jgi:hypothetical protein